MLNRHEGCSKRSIPWLDRRAIERLEAAAGSLSPADADVEVVVAGDEFVRELNRVYRGIDRPTDVLSFSYFDESERQPGENTVGEVYISCDTIETRARERGVAPEHLFLRVGVHGLLHVVGHVHGTPADAQRMEAEERRLLLQYLTPPEVEELL